MDSRTETCLRWGRPVELGFHACPFNVVVVDPEPLRNCFDSQDHTIEDELVSQGHDINQFIRFALDEDRKFEQEYLSGDLTYRVEFINVTGLGFQEERSIGRLLSRAEKIQI